MTFSIVAQDPNTGQLGVASQSHYFALGRVVTFAQAGVGAVATQSFVEPSYGPKGLAMLSEGVRAEEALMKLVEADADRELRQVAFLDAQGGVSAFTGNRCVPSRRDLSGDGFVVLGNMLSNDEVVPAMYEAFQQANGDLADRILAALDAAEAAGGDARGRMSASLAIVDSEPGEHPWEGRLFDLRVDEHEYPLRELRRLVELSRAHTVFGNSVFTPGLLSSDSPTMGAELAHAIRQLDEAQLVIGDDPEPLLWQGVLLARAGDLARAKPFFQKAVQKREALRGFLDALNQVGILPLPAHEVLTHD